jgi:hypothetical protein
MRLLRKRELLTCTYFHLGFSHDQRRLVTAVTKHGRPEMERNPTTGRIVQYEKDLLMRTLLQERLNEVGLIAFAVLQPEWVTVR